MDGTIYLGDKVFPYTKKFFKLLDSKGIDYLLFTNNSSKDRKKYMKNLKKMSLDLGIDKILTSGDVTMKFLKTQRTGKLVYLVGTPLLEKAFLEEEIELVSEDPDIVVVSFDTTLTYEKLEKACRFIRKGAEFISTHCDINCPTENGFIPDSGSICALITASTSISPRFFGKPFKETIEMIEHITGHKRSNMAIIGDRLYTDIKMGVSSGIKAILVLSGETKESDLIGATIKPDFIYKDLEQVMNDIP